MSRRRMDMARGAISGHVTTTRIVTIGSIIVATIIIIITTITIITIITIITANTNNKVADRIRARSHTRRRRRGVTIPAHQAAAANE